MNDKKRVALTGFMGVGKSSVARHLAHLLHCRRIDLDFYTEECEGRKIAEIIDAEGIDRYREIETLSLERLLIESHERILSLGGGTWTVGRNRELLKQHDFTTVWLESDFEHCWLNITHSRKDRPLARNKQKALQLFNERQKVYCLADWHFVIRKGYTSYDLARQIADSVFA
jgi:shikimate kinase